MESIDKDERPQKPLSRHLEGAAQPAQCLFCGSDMPDRSRRTKKFCQDLCRSRFHYARRQAAQVDLKRRLEEAEARLRRLDQRPDDPARHSVE